MKTIAIIMTCLLVAAEAGAEQPTIAGPLTSVDLKIIDDQGAPIADADVNVHFRSYDEKPSDIQRLKSDTAGVVKTVGNTPLGVSIYATKSGHYEAREMPPIGPNRIIERTYVLPRILSQIPLFAARDESLHLPVQNEWVSYDFEARDWAAPHGKGKHPHIRFRYRKQFKGYLSEGENLERSRELSKRIAQQTGRSFSEEDFKWSAGKWDGVLEVSFANPKEGMVEEEKRFLPYSLLKLPHLAPETDYEPTRRYEANTYKGWPPERATGFFVRTRVQLDAKGEIISANYAKIYGDLRFDPRGTVRIWYYFNPVPNDQNLEFDIKRNLLPERSASDGVRHP